MPFGVSPPGRSATAIAADGGEAVDELAQEPPLVRFQVLTLIRVGDLRASGL